MRKITIMRWLVFIVCGLLLAGNALAMSSTNYRIDWFVPLTGSGGGKMTSANYGVHTTIGQSFIGSAASTNYQVGLGFWYGNFGPSMIYLPIILRN